MKKISKYNLIILWWILFTMLIWWTIYATLSNPSWQEPTEEVQKWDPLTADSWNKTQENIKFLYEKINSLETTITSLNWTTPSWAVVSFNISTCPTGRKLADWNNGTPNLKDRFIVWAWWSYAFWNTWWTGIVTGTISDTTLSINQIPSHNHSSSVGNWWTTTITAYVTWSGIPSCYNISGTRLSCLTQSFVALTSSSSSTTWNTWWWQAHTHTFTWGSNLPPYYALIYCVKE
jgi:hypothetical protein